MKRSIGTRQVLNILLVLSWIIFIGVSIEAGGFLTNAFFALVNPAVVKHLWQQADLSDLFNYNTGHYFTQTLLIAIVSVMRAWLFYLIIKMLHDKNFNPAQPFNKQIVRFIFTLSYVVLLIGLFSVAGVRYAEWLVIQGVKMPDTQYLRVGGADVWLFMSIILFVIAQLFKRGIDIQTENELTI